MNHVRKVLHKRNKTQQADEQQKHSSLKSPLGEQQKHNSLRNPHKIKPVVTESAREPNHSDTRNSGKRWNVRRRSGASSSLSPSVTKYLSPTVEQPSQTSKVRSPGSDATFVPEEQDPLVRTALECEEGKFLSIDQCNKVTAAVAALDKSGTDLFAQGNYKQAFLRFERALALKRRSLIDHSVAWKKYEETESSKHHINRSVASDETTATSDDNSVPLNTLNSLSILRSHPTYKATQKINTKNVKDDNDDEYSRNLVASVATSINNLTFLKQQNGQSSNEETLASYMQCLQMKLEVLGPHHLSVGKTLNNIGSVFYVQGNYTASLQSYLDAHSIMAAELGPDHLDVATVASNIGDAYRCIGGLDEKALIYYRLALEIRWKALPNNHPKITRLMEQTASLELTQGENALLNPCRQADSDELSVEGSEGEIERQASQADIKFIEELERKATEEVLSDKETFTRELQELLVIVDDNDCSEDSHKRKATLRNGFSLGNHSANEVNSNTSRLDFNAPCYPKINEKAIDTVIVEEHTTDTGDLDVRHQTKAPFETKMPLSHSGLANGNNTFDAESTRGRHDSHPLPKLPRAKLSAEERRRALTSVKERLAKIRALRARTSYDVIGKR